MDKSDRDFESKSFPEPRFAGVAAFIHLVAARRQLETLLLHAFQHIARDEKAHLAVAQLRAIAPLGRLPVKLHVAGLHGVVRRRRTATA